MDARAMPSGPENAAVVISQIERLVLEPDEVLFVKVSDVSFDGLEALQRGFRDLAARLGWDKDRIVIVDGDFDLIVGKAK